MSHRTPTIPTLIGLRGSGKSTIGRALAAACGRSFVDLDDHTPGVLGEATAADALRRHGEPAFRHAELQALRDVATADCVLALGGGTPTATGFGTLAGELGLRLIYLRCTPATLRARLAATDTATRPSLTGKGTLDEIDEVFGRRDPIYTEIAHKVVACDDLDESALLAELRDLLG